MMIPAASLTGTCIGLLVRVGTPMASAFFWKSMQRARDYVAHMNERDLERKRIFWRGDRIEWILARGFHPWFFKEVNEGRAIWPGAALPAHLNQGPSPVTKVSSGP
jgi:hypothetical protein